MLASITHVSRYPVVGSDCVFRSLSSDPKGAVAFPRKDGPWLSVFNRWA